MKKHKGKILLEEYSKIIDKNIEDFFESKTGDLSDGSLVNKVLESLKESCLAPGKRFRPALLYYSYRSFAGQDFEMINRVAVAIEFIHVFLLIHDDIIDHSDYRRGRPSCYQEFGNDLAILSGDLLGSFVFEICSKSLSDEYLAKVLEVISDTLTITIYGQFMEIDLQNQNQIDISSLTKVYRSKTAQYSFALPLKIAGICSDLDMDLSEDVDRISNYMGIAFQIKNDILDLSGEDMGRDIKNRKQTLIRCYAEKNFNNFQLKTFNQIFEKLEITDRDVDMVVNLYAEVGAIDYVREYAGFLVRKAFVDFDNFEKKYFGGGTRSDLRQILEYISTMQ